LRLRGADLNCDRAGLWIDLEADDMQASRRCSLERTDDVPLLEGQGPYGYPLAIFSPGRGSEPVAQYLKKTLAFSAASFARVRLTMSLSVPSDRRIRHMPG
jgi:hypothetical protein